jgi:hypothetical protein
MSIYRLIDIELKCLLVKCYLSNIGIKYNFEILKNTNNKIHITLLFSMSTKDSEPLSINLLNVNRQKALILTPNRPIILSKSSVMNNTDDEHQLLHGIVNLT